VGKGLERVDGEGEPGPEHLAIVDFEPGNARGGDPGHLKTVPGSRHPFTDLLPGIAGGNEEDPIEPCLKHGALSRMEMGDVNRVEGSAEDPGTHVPEDRPGEVGGDGARG